MKFLIITGNYRSGTSYLQKVIDNGKNFEIIHQPIFFIFKLFDQKYKNKKHLKCPVGINLEKKIIESKPKNLWIDTINLKIELNKIIKTKKNNPIFNHLKKKFFIILYSKFNFDKKKTNLEECIKKNFESIIEYRKNFKKNTTIGFKEAYISSFIPSLLKMKNVYIINVIRDPKEIYVSRNFSINPKNESIKKKKHPLLMVISLCMNNFIIDKYLKKKRSSKYISLQFNHLINKNMLIQKLSKKIGFKKIYTKIYDKDNKKVWKINTSGKNTRGNYGSDWRKILDNRDKEIIDDIKYNFLVRKDFLKDKIANKNLLKWTQIKYFLSYKQFNKIIGKYFLGKSKYFNL